MTFEQRKESSMPVTHNRPLSAELQALLDSSNSTMAIDTSEIRYIDRGKEYGAFRAAPVDLSSPVGAVLVMSDWAGLGDHARVRAQMLAHLGYVGIAGDVYGDGANLPPKQAQVESAKYYSDPALFRSRMRTNLEFVRSQPDIDPARIAVIGYCFGGTGALELARDGARVAGVASFHGGLATTSPAGFGDIRTPVLVLTGGADPLVPDAAVVEFQEEMRSAETTDWQVHTYSGAMHSFAMPDANTPQIGAQFHALANKRSWTTLRAFLEETIG
jgi:dienelactone hydrolase